MKENWPLVISSGSAELGRGGGVGSAGAQCLNDFSQHSAHFSALLGAEPFFLQQSKDLLS